MKFSIKSFNSNFKGTFFIPVLENESGVEIPDGMGLASISSSVFSGKKEIFHVTENGPSEQIFVWVGLGKDPNYQSIKTAFRRLTAKKEELFQKENFILIPDFFNEKFLEAAVSGLVLGTYRLGFYKEKSDRQKDWSKVKVHILSEEKSKSKIINRAQKIAEAKMETCRLVDLPANEVTPYFLSEWAKKLGKDSSNLKVQVFDAKKAEKLGLHAFLAVGRGSKNESQFIVIEYRPKAAEKHIGLVGKGVTFDTGGYNIKTAGMVHMKCDMGGAATVLGAMKLVSELDLPIQVTAVVPCVENRIDNQSFLPSDVIRSYSGKSIEIIDTDAEGRLILADGLAYLTKNYQTDILIDFATLTGSAVGTFGYVAAALFTNNEDLSKAIQESGKDIGEKSWPLPLWDDYKSEMDSEIADIKNYYGKPFAGAITAAKFLEVFTNGHSKWAHLDIAGTAYGDSEFAKSKHATAYGVHLLLNLLEKTEL